MAEFSLELNDDQKQIQSWVHDFAEQVIRPAGEEWDEREETPWPIIQEAAKIGLYSMDFMANALMGDPTGLTMRSEEHTSELQSLMRISYAVFCLKTKKHTITTIYTNYTTEQTN